MKVLLDECVTKKLRSHLTEFEVYTIAELGLTGIKNGQLMAYCVDNSVDVLLTIDKNLMFQQNLDRYPLTIIVFNCRTSKLEELVLFIDAFKALLPFMEKHQAYLLDR